MSFPSSSGTNVFFTHDLADISETQFLKDSIVNHTKYGSTNQNSSISQNYRYITHYVEPSDTFQGLSLKYGCKVCTGCTASSRLTTILFTQIENIKKFNKLFSYDNNHLRSRLSILIPIETSSQMVEVNLSTKSNSKTNANDLCCESRPANNNGLLRSRSPLNSQSFDRAPSDRSQTTQPSKSLSLSDSPSASSCNQNESAADFLIRIDSSIARTKSQVENLSKRTNDTALEGGLFKSTKFDTPKLIPKNKKALFSSSSSSTSLFGSSAGGGGDLPSVSVSNSKKRISTSLKRLEKSQEEIFEL